MQQRIVLILTSVQVLRTLRNLREKKDVRGVLGVLETSVRTNYAGVESSRYED